MSLSPVCRGTIGRTGACFDNASFDASDPANGNTFCSRIGRDAGGASCLRSGHPAVVFGFVKGNEISFSGIQSVLDWRRDMSDIGLAHELELTGELFYTRRHFVAIRALRRSAAMAKSTTPNLLAKSICDGSLTRVGGSRRR